MKKDINLWLTQDIQICEFGLYINSAKCFVISDLQFGQEGMLNKQGLLIPRFNFGEVKKSLGKAFASLSAEGKPIEKFIIAGDIKHEFGEISDQEWKEVLDLAEFLQPNCREIIFVKGNHDIFLGALAKWKNIRLEQEGYWLAHWPAKEKIYITHGHKIFDNQYFREAKILIIGHDHPAITLREGVKSETYKCFLKGKFKGKILIVMPSFNFLAIGTNISREKVMSPFLKQSLANFKVWAIEDKPYYFGKIGKL